MRLTEKARCRVRCSALQHPSNSTQVVENIGALHAALQPAAVRCAAPPPFRGVQRSSATEKINGLEHVGRIMARLAVQQPDRWGWLLPPTPPKDFSPGAGGGWADCANSLATGAQIMRDTTFSIDNEVIHDD